MNNQQAHHREIILDTETTGLDTKDGHRVIEIGLLELVNKIPTGKTFRAYFNPKRSVPMESFKVHGLTEQFLSSFGDFQEKAHDIIMFIGQSPLVIHNASFDLKFLRHEYSLIENYQESLPSFFNNVIIDTVFIARKQFPRQKNTLDALCTRFNIDLSGRTYHGALLDCMLLAQVYLELCGGAQNNLWQEEKIVGKEQHPNAESNTVSNTVNSIEEKKNTDNKPVRIPRQFNFSKED